jgi:hypothetical protein
MIRHVRTPINDLYWKECYQCIRRFYPTHKIVIIDDNSNMNHLKNDIECVNTTVIQSEFPGRGELLPYYYYLKYGKNWFKKAIILHDSVFIQKRVDFHCNLYKILWSFRHTWDTPSHEKELIRSLDNAEILLDFHDNKHKWVGCFGCMTIISHEFLSYIDSIHNLKNLLNVVKTRDDRCGFERVIACLVQCYSYDSDSNAPNILLNDIHDYVNNKFITFSDYQSGNFNRDLPVVKVWSGR